MQNDKLKRYFIGVYGCQMNFAEAERMEGELQSLGYIRTDKMSEADLILLDTCCIRETAEEKIYGKLGEIKHLKKKNPSIIAGIAGCMAQKEKDSLLVRAPHLDFVLGTAEYSRLGEIIRKLEVGAKPIVATKLSMQKAEPVYEVTTPIIRASKLSAWIPIMYGCDNFCSYCIVPYVRGRERSRLPEDILREVKEAVKNGYKEVTLLGQNVNSYGKDHKAADFSDLLKMVDEVDGICRVRFTTSHPKDLSDKLIDTLKSGKHLCEHIHLPIQHGNDKLLKAMNRHYTVDEYRQLLKKIRTAIPDVSITTDLIVGFPGETEEDFADLLSFVQEARYDSAYTFMYSPRSGTPAAKLTNQVPDDIKKMRLQKLMDVQNNINLERNRELLGRKVEVLVEGASKYDSSVWQGRTRTNKLVLFARSNVKAGDLVEVRITQPQTWVLKGELC